MFSPGTRARTLYRLNHVNRRSKNVAARSNDIACGQNSGFVDHCGRSILYAFFGRIENMVIATVLFVAFVIATGVAIVKAYEWHQDVLYGPYLKRID
jgi:hypothetical protein